MRTEIAHPENLTRVMITPYIIGRELERLRGGKVEPMEPKISGSRWECFFRHDGVALFVACEVADLLASLDEFAEKHLKNMA